MSHIDDVMDRAAAAGLSAQRLADARDEVVRTALAWTEHAVTDRDLYGAVIAYRSARRRASSAREGVR
jgi:hypothetical protein